MSGQSVLDRMTAVKHSIAGQGLAKAVCKSTTEEVMGPKKKHLDYLLQCTNEPNVSIPQLANLLIERTQNQNWVVVFKSLITIHNLMNYGNERFTQYLASNNCTFNLGNFIDKGGVQGYDMSTFVRRYSKYLNEKAVSYRLMAFDFCKVRRGKEDGLLRTMNTEKLLKTLPCLQKQLDGLLEFDCTQNELTNGVINACFLLLFKDLIRLFACYNDGVINLLEKYFDMNKKQCKDALDSYKKFLVRMDKVSEFLKVAENVGIDKGDIPDLAKGLKTNTESSHKCQSSTRGSKHKKMSSAPSSLLDALEQHLQALEGKKGATTPSGSKPAGFASAINTMSNNSSSIQVSDEEKKRILDEENQRLSQLKDQFGANQPDFANEEQKLKETVNNVAPPPAQPANQTTNPFATPAPPSSGQDLFGSPTKPTPNNTGSVKPSDDLLNLTGNPFVESVQNVMVMNNAMSGMQQQQQQQQSFAAWNNSTGVNSAPATGSGFTSEADFEKVFQNQGSSSTGGMLTLDVSRSAMAAPLTPTSPAPSVPPEEEFLDPLDPLAPGGMGSTSSTGMGALDDICGPQGVLGGMSSGPPPLQGMPIPGVSSNIQGTQILGSSPSVSSQILGSSPGAQIMGSSPVIPSHMTGAQVLSSSPKAFPDMTMPASPAVGRVSPAPSSTSDQGSGFDAFGEVLQPNVKQGQKEDKKQEKLIQQDLDTSLVQLAGNLNINGPGQQVKKQQHDWQPKGEQKKTGGANWSGQSTVSSTTWTSGFAPTGMPAQTAPPMGYNMPPGQPMMQPNMMGAPRPMGAPMGQPAGMGMQPGMGMGMGQPGMYGTQPMGGMMGQPRPPTQTQNDPFGAL